MGNSQNYALITGATSGIGYELSKLFAQDGINLIIVARSEDNLEQVAAELRQVSSIDVKTIAADLFDPKAAKDVYEKATGFGVNIEYLVNNAGQGEWGRFFKTDIDRSLDIIQLNIASLVSLTHCFLKDMVARNSGRILQLASSFSKTPAPYMAVYAATKAFVLSFTEAIIKELDETNVTVTALLPGATDTDWFLKAKAENTVAYKEGELYDPADVAKGGYDALMKGEATAQPGFKNKMQNAMSVLLPNGTDAAMVEKQTVSSMQPDGRKIPTHSASARERESINSERGGINGDRKLYDLQQHSYN